MEYQSETKNCQNCKKDFIIEPDDFLFYEKIKVPSPTFCPECRMIRRMMWRNTRSLNRRECFLCKKVLISMYSDEEVHVACVECWNSDKWDQFQSAINYDFSQKFFDQWYSLLKKAPRIFAYRNGNLVNSDYTNYTVDNKNAYLSYSVVECEDVMYSEAIDKSKKSFDCYGSQKLDNCSNNIDCDGNYNTQYAIRSRNCIDSYFVYDCINCQNCFLSYNLRNKKYFYKNQQLSREEYQKIIEEAKLDTYTGISLIHDIFLDTIKNTAINRFSQIFNSVNVSGDNIINSHNIKNSYNVHDSENIKYSNRVLLHTKDSMDLQGLGSGELIYESVAASFNTYKNYFCYITLESKECEYSFLLKNCSNCFACIGLKNASYCIFNKQYEKEEYFEMIEKIKKHMDDMPYVDSKGRVYKYGEFFPFEMSPFGYNETNNLDYFPIDKKEAQEKGYPWRSKEKRDYHITIRSVDLPDSLQEVDDSILNEIIGCPGEGDERLQCTTAYKIMPDELSFYKQKGLPVPRYCPNCRHYQRFVNVNPLKLWHRTCMHEGCINEFETSYAPERSEIIYCERCYQQEVC
ncbi:MAG: hypothetical protein UR85_C0008G0002 [Candidatus Nomurabacteria bacterium GW2011_GWF2_35_66]|uniref:Uncharacterized protein n=1 Tax=Candidatus Nomurabacteria bacterium GW2011_GWE1_35_16 TaxID=1618761 RepID=A0A0G0EFW9_9BACT|nr:MAG: hypothetical protein UR55_C0011G0002 [Candidatus Nomurabacteria bacterium GW2011_GWF1_34_20]KKP62838.1 MAG: hypothetical protein UR57_C0010G0002 [Candidatus Nomurabacteria bacterium GW2011_GWE2_34_25]KKP66237.1 MAG: hypothetical protein UR64_C0010G0002 [Candidatus Nomurabacteria bacterium GW2011_GWE1_35_16]KKP83069.1 MAG: hypothetical protein UR85_C0008G0002 [Candidatus Nomurabacteria bacterium GW2011_GWF2_35_66]HAE36664.1 hypothetical protein [Candidatus Nomurabacteria bacterium]